MSPTNQRETGGRTPQERTGPDPSDAFSQAAAKNRKPALGVGLSERVDDVNDETHRADGVDPARSGVIQKSTGAGPALAEHSKDAHASHPSPGRSSSGG